MHPCSCTENEARRYARFLRETLALVTRWHNDESVFESECGRKVLLVSVGICPCGMVKFYHSFSFNAQASGPVTFESFKQIFYKWQLKLARSFLFLLGSPDSSVVRKAIIVLTNVR